jgi:hypothetical protein
VVVRDRVEEVQSELLQCVTSIFTKQNKQSNKTTTKTNNQNKQLTTYNKQHTHTHTHIHTHTQWIEVAHDEDAPPERLRSLTISGKRPEEKIDPKRDVEVQRRGFMTNPLLEGGCFVVCCLLFVCCCLFVVWC